MQKPELVKEKTAVSEAKSATATLLVAGSIIVASVAVGVWFALSNPPLNNNTNTSRTENQKSTRQSSQPHPLAKPIHSTDPDYPIAREIANAYKALQQKRTKEAVVEFAALTENVKSIRAYYGLALALDQLSEERQSNEILDKAIAAYKKMWDLVKKESSAENKEILKRAIVRLADRQGFSGNEADAVESLRRLIDVLPGDTSVLNELALHYLLTGQNDKAKAVIEDVLGRRSDDGFALGHYGFLLKLETKYEEAVPYLYRGIRGDDDRCREGRFYFHLGDALHRLGRRDEAYEIYSEATRMGLFKSPWQRSLYNVDRLDSRPWWNPVDTPYVKSIQMLERNWEVIRDEGLAVMDVGRGGFEAEDENLRESGQWLQFTLFQRGFETKSCNRVPKTCQIVRQIKEAARCSRGQIKYSVMHPGTHIWPHTGPTNCRLRMHLGLVIPKGVNIRCGSETKVWEEGKVIIFDDSFEHEVWHNGSSFRLIFIIDVWHPDLTESEKRTLPPI